MKSARHLGLLIATVLMMLVHSASGAVMSYPSASSCGMPCCQPLVAERQPESCCGRKAPAPTECKCEFKSSSNQLPHDAILNSTSSLKFEIQVIALVPAAPSITIEALEGALPGMFGADSGPPLSRPHCAWLGRAPPVFLA